jgi:predicted transcriptional regulator
MSIYAPADLKNAAEEVKAGGEPRVSVRSFLWWFRQERRGWRVVNRIRRELSDLNLRTVPDFEHQWIDGYVTIMPVENEIVESVVSDEQVEPSVNEEEQQESITLVEGAVEDPTYRIGKLDAANNPPISVKPDDPLNAAVTIMLREEFSQLPVMTNERDVKGAVTWRTIACRLAFGKECSVVRDCMDRSVEIVNSDVSLFRVIDQIAINDFVLVRDKERKISGIVTTADLSESFHQLGQPFLLLGEIENQLRRVIDKKFTIDELKEVQNPSDTDREIASVSDLTFGEYVRLLQNEGMWKKVGLSIDRVTFIKDLERTNGIRNDVMHFDPDGIGPDDLEFLKKVAGLMQVLREIVEP